MFHFSLSSTTYNYKAINPTNNTTQRNPIQNQPNTYFHNKQKWGFRKINREKEREKDPPGHIGLISENQPGITAEIQSGCCSLLLPSTSIVTAKTPFSSSSSLGLFTWKSVDPTTLSSAISLSLFLYLSKTPQPQHTVSEAMK